MFRYVKNVASHRSPSSNVTTTSELSSAGVHWRESPLARLAVFWDWDDLRSEPRFQNLLARLNLPR